MCPILGQSEPLLGQPDITMLLNVEGGLLVKILLFQKRKYDINQLNEIRYRECSGNEAN